MNLLLRPVRGRPVRAIGQELLFDLHLRLKTQGDQLAGQIIHFGFGELIVFKTAMEK